MARFLHKIVQRVRHAVEVIAEQPGVDVQVIAAEARPTTLGAISA